MEIRLHDDEIPIENALVRNLVNAQFPQHTTLPLSRLGASGSTNALFRLGADLLVRLPRQPGGGAAIDKEHLWLPKISSHLSVEVPEVVAVGEPALGYCEQWSIVRWLEGEHPKVNSSGYLSNPGSLTLAADLADVVLALRAIDVPESAAADQALRGYRGRSLAGFDEQTRHNIQQCRSIEGLDLDLDAALAIWDDALNTPGADELSPDRWYHGDLVAENLLLSDGRLSAVLDFGGLAVGDPTIDLHGAWELLDQPAREVFRTRVGADDAEWLRGRAWALGIALGTFTYYWEKMPGRRRDRMAMARSVLADASQSRTSFAEHT